MPRLADTRKMTIDDARATFERIARAQIRIWRRQAACEDRIARIKSDLDETNAEDTRIVADSACELREFILAHRDLFQKPRKMKTQFGTFGLETEKELKVTDEEALLQAILTRGYDDCTKVERSILKKPIASRIAAGETFPGCTVLEGDVAKYKVDKSLMDEVTVADQAAAQ